MSNPLLIKSSWLSSHEYCEYKWYLEHVKGIEIPRTKAMVKGKEIHQNKEDEFLEVATPTTMQEFLKSTKYTITKEIFLSKKFNDFILIGKIDELGIDANNVYVIEDKPNARPFIGNLRQLWTYCLLFDSNFKINKKIYAILRDRDTNVEKWKKEYEEKDRTHALEALNRLKKLLNKEIKPRACQVPARCNACILHKLKRCDYSVGY